MVMLSPLGSGEGHSLLGCHLPAAPGASVGQAGNLPVGTIWSAKSQALGKGLLSESIILCAP